MTRRAGGTRAGKLRRAGNPAAIGADARCYLCGTDDGLSYCTFCEKYFCARCERNYPGRVAAATLERFTALKALVASALPVELAAPPKASPDDSSCCGAQHRRERERT